MRFKEASGLSWAELARRLGTFPLTVRRWWKLGVRPNTRHLMALLELAEELGLLYLLTARQARCETRPGITGQGGTIPRNSPKGKPRQSRAAVRGRNRSNSRIHQGLGERR